ncbi:MAG TPA: hypothetical protein VHL80_04315 [Polyangia bacterium]|nr:hypothetical protein [Polyangia bacterium]
MSPSDRSSHLPASPSDRLPAPRGVGLASLLLLAPLALSAGACKVDKAAFEARIFKCDTTAPDPLCGTDADGKAMTCFAARQIGGTDFCTKACDMPMSLPDEDAVCVQGGAELKFCNPADDGTDAHPLGACDRSDLGCLRTDVEQGAAEGVCITGSPCLADTDCKDPVRSTCAATFLDQLYSGWGGTLPSDHLYCLQEGCVSGDTACSPGETCLPKVIPAAANPPDICVPNCDSQEQCPPNHFCLSKISGPANPKVCIPGLLGFVCETDVDCLVGKCHSDNPDDTSTALNLCTVSCTSDDDCSKYDSLQGDFFCSAGSDRHCVTPNAYTGALCRTDADCDAGMRDKGTKCFRQAPDDPTGTCLYACDPTMPGMCKPRDGVGHTCIPLLNPEEPGACFPATFGFPCFADTDCAVPDLKCAGVDPARGLPGLCTRLCTADVDCTGDRWVGAGTYCGPPDTPICLPLGKDGDACAADKQCASGTCAAPAMSGSPVADGGADDGGAEAGAPMKTCGGK